jgi:hypothetical protein
VGAFNRRGADAGADFVRVSCEGADLLIGLDRRFDNSWLRDGLWDEACAVARN